MRFDMKKTILGIFAGIVLVTLFVVLCTFVRRPYERILIDRFGDLKVVPDKGTIAYNWYFKLPTDNIVRIDTRLHVLALPFKEFNTKNREPLMVRAYLVWRINDPLKFRQKAGGSDEQAERLMTAQVTSLMRQDLGGHSLDEFFNSADPRTDERIRALEKGIATQATQGDATSPGLKDMGIEIADVGFSRIAFPVSNTEAVYQRMVAELNGQARAYQTSGKKEADIIIAEGNRKAQEIVGAAKREAGQIRGEGDARAADAIRQVSNSPAAMEFYEYWKNLDVLKSTLTKNTYFVLSTDHPFIKNLFDGLKGAPASNDATALSPPVLIPPATRPNSR
jgi:modulator of FtsH protease HflC